MDDQGSGLPRDDRWALLILVVGAVLLAFGAGIVVAATDLDALADPVVLGLGGGMGP
ncbi:hypothetical protein L6R50_08000 [Myxococcota bacterium]|nr:hypothetical protein [Myxococcota bacterium]